jgi:DNA (cytosine-5)-methyltransferase 1
MYGLDLFSGIGGITKALEGYVEPVAYCENDRYAQAVLLSRMRSGDLPIARIWDDVVTLNGAMLPRIDIIYGGSPCQDISVAGRGAGLEGKRSGLFFEIVRLISEIRPQFVFLENVAVITVRGAERVVGELCRLRYDCRWGILSAADVGANHRRERWWLLAHANSNGSGSWGATRKGQQRRRPLIQSSTPMAHTSGEQGGWVCKPRFQPDARGSGETAYPQGTKLKRDGAKPNGEPSGSSNASWWATEPDVGRVAHGIPFRVDRLRGLGNAVVPVQAREAFERLMGLK